MNTAEALEAMTDRGKFERLVISILRSADSDCSAIIHTGINAQGETIPSPVDGFCLVPGSKPDRFLLLQVTTTDRTGLRNKWLNGDVGDLSKAHNLALEIREKNPDAEFVIILATNQHLTMEDKLAMDVYEKAKELKLSCRIWEQTLLAGFLDNKPEGHWLRRSYLGIEAELLSESLLSYICKGSLASYEKDIQLSDPSIWLQRTIDEFIHIGVSDNKYTFLALVGESGFGKSVAAYMALKKHIESGGYGLWVPAEIIRDCLSLESIVDKVLRELYPSLSSDSGRNVSQLIRKDSKFILVVDDVNRIDDPRRTINRLLSWSRPDYSDIDSAKQPSSPFFIICPLWPQIWDRDQNNNSWVHTVSVGPMTSEESLTAIRLMTSEKNVSLTDAEYHILAVKLGNDPVLIGLFSQILIKDTYLTNLYEMAEGVVERFIGQRIEEVASNTKSSYLSSEYKEALSELCVNILRKCRFYPSWEEVQVWFEKEPETLRALRELVRNKNLIRLTDQENKLIFRHDRIRETLLIESMISLLKDPSSNAEILREPYYTEIIGRAIILSPQNEDFIKDLAENLPLALFEALKNFGNPTTDYHRKIIDAIKNWIEKNLVAGVVLESIIISICWCLMDTDSNVVLELTQKFSPYWPILLSRLRNGSAKSGAAYCNRIPIDTGDNLRDQIIEHAKNRHKEQLLEELKLLLSSADSTDKERKGTLALAGFLEFPGLEKEIADCWNLANDKGQVLAESIWAGARCCSDQPDKLLGPMTKYLADLSEKRNSDIEERPRIRVSEKLASALSRGISNRVTDYFISLHGVCKPLNWPIVIMLEYIDAPDVIELLIRFAARENGTIFAMYQLSDAWDPTHSIGRRLSNPSIDRLKTLWSSLRTDKLVKYQAFRIWANNAQQGQIDILKEISTESSLYHMALRKRARLGDLSVAQQLASFLSTDVHMFDVAHHVWCSEIMSVTEQYLESLKNKTPDETSGYSDNLTYYLSRLLTSIPSDDAEMLLEKYWGHLRCIPRFVQAALYIGTDKSMKLADSSIKGCSGNIPLFERLELTFGFFEESRQDLLTKQHLERLAPYLDKCDEDILRDLAEVCQHLGIPEWNKEYISSKLTAEWRAHFYPTDEDLLRELDKFAADLRWDSDHLVWHFTHWVEKFDVRHDSRANTIIGKWFKMNCNIRGLQVVAAFLKVRGTRKDLHLLDMYTIEGPLHEILKIKDDVRYSIHRRSLE